MREKEQSTFGVVSIINHWTIAAVFIGMLCFGFFLEYGGLPREARGPLMGLHKSIGVVFLLFASWRVLWRLFQGFPKEVAGMPQWQTIAAKLTHWVLLIAVIAMPASGVLMGIYGGRSINVFDLFTIPEQERNSFILEVAHWFHGNAPYVISAIIVLHIAAAVKHHIVDKDATLKRMIGIKA